MNLMKGGIVYSILVTTVSPTHAGEVRDKGQGLEGTFKRTRKFGGILNGIDYDAWKRKATPYFAPPTAPNRSIKNTRIRKHFVSAFSWLTMKADHCPHRAA